MIQLHVTKMELTPVKTAAEAKFLAYLSPLSISFRKLYHTTESNKNLIFQKLGHMSNDIISRYHKELYDILVIFMSRVPK